MAIIGKIREKSILLVIIIGIALLAFIVGDWISTRGVGNEGKYGVGHVFGEKIDQAKFDNLRRKFQNKYGDDFVWDYYVDSVIMNNEYDELGITVSDKEFESYLKGDTTKGFDLKNIYASSQERRKILNQFYQATQGQGPIPYLYSWLQSNRQNDSMAVPLISQIKKNKEDWNFVKLFYLDSRKKEKYLDIVSQGIYVTSVEAEDDFKGKENKKSIRYVFKPSNSIEDSLIKFTENDLIKYYVDHKYDGKYQNDKAYRKVKFFSLSDAPSSSDSSQFFGVYNTIKQEFANAENDTVYSDSKSELKINSTVLTVFPANHPKAKNWYSYPSALDSLFKSSKIGDIVGPYKCSDTMNSNIENGILRQKLLPGVRISPSMIKGKKYYALSKVIGKTPSRIKARQILVRINEGEDSSKVEADAQYYRSLLSSSRNRNITFDTLKKYSADPIGEYDNLTEEFLNFPDQNENRTQFYGTEISQFCTYAPVGSVKLIESKLGFHIVEIMERDALDLPKLATVYKEFKPSQETMQTRFNNADALIENGRMKIPTLSNQDQIQSYFDSIIDAGGYQSEIAKMFDNAPKAQLNNETIGDKLIEVAYKKNSKVGKFFLKPALDYDTYVIGMLYEVRKKGTPTYEEIRSEIKKDFLVAKKNQIIMKNLSGKTLDELESSESVNSAEVSFSNPNNRGVPNFDDKVIGSLFSNNGPKEKQITKPLVGSTGVYVIYVEKLTKATEKKSYKVEKTLLNKSEMGSIKGSILNSELINGLYDRANAIDNRKLQNMKIRN